MLEKITDFLGEYMDFIYLALFVIVAILLVICTISFCKANRKFVKKIEETEPEIFVSFHNAQEFKGKKEFKSYDFNRDARGRFIKKGEKNGNC